MRFAPVFSDNAVLQREQAIPVWGVTRPDAEVVVRLGGSTATVVSGTDGRWMVRLPPMPAGGPWELVATSEASEARICNVLIGDVWICSGQSNMEWQLHLTPQAISEEEGNLTRMRLLTVKTPARLGVQEYVDGRWAVATKETLGRFSAVGVWFGKRLMNELDVPIGLICNAYSGTRVQAWMSREALMSDVYGRTEVQAYEAFAYNAVGKCVVPAMDEWLKEIRARDVVNLGQEKGWHARDFDDSGWTQMPVPSRWQDHGHGSNGVVWFRRSMVIPADWRETDLEAELGSIDKHDETYVNGVRVGGLSWDDGNDTWCTPRKYRIDRELVESGKIVIAVRVRSHCYHGGLIGPAEAMRIHRVDSVRDAVSLMGMWRYAVEQDWGVITPPTTPMLPGSPNAPFTLYDSRVAPLVPYGIKGFVWYQGESNAHEADFYRAFLAIMIEDWRRAFGQGDIPFVQVQLAAFRRPLDMPAASTWAELRDSQRDVASMLPNVGYVATIDVGDQDNVHPPDKRSVGERLARWVCTHVYGFDGSAAGPELQSIVYEPGARIRCRFEKSSGLRTRDGTAPGHVAVAGFDKAFVWAEAVIDGDDLVVWSPRVARPYYVRYAWADNPMGANLVDGDGLPVAPFTNCPAK